MALLPIPYTKNWADVFGSQVSLPEQAAKIPPVIIATASFTGGVIRVTWTGGQAPFTVVPPFGAPIEGAVSPLNVPVTRSGDYLVEVRCTNFPDNRAKVKVRVADWPQPSVVVTWTEEGMRLNLDFSNVSYPLVIDWGDGSNRYEEFYKGKIGHTYDEPGTYVVHARGSNGHDLVTEVTTEEPEEPEEGE